MYLYESHMGGLYTTAEQQDWEDLYCEECGDSDREIGTFENAKELWELVRPSSLACIGCGKSGECFEPENCPDACGTGTDYSLTYCMGLVSGFAEEGEGRTVSLICRNIETGRYFVNFKPKGYVFGESVALPESFCLLPELEEKTAYALIPAGCKPVRKPEKKAVSEDGKTVFVCCEVSCDREEDIEDEDAAWKYGDGWYGWISDREYTPPC